MAHMLSASIVTCHTAILFLFVCTGVSSFRKHVSRVQSDVTYDELIKLNATCYGLDSCRSDRGTEDLQFVNCHCGPSCAKLGTCCVDSKYRTPRRSYEIGGVGCLKPYGNVGRPLFMVEGCRRDWDGEDFVEDLCHGDGVELNDPLLLVTVSSARTGITYRNYFCFVCNVDVEVDRPVFWNVKLVSESENVSGHSLPDLSYSKRIWSWTVRGRNNPVSISLEVPQELLPLVKWCRDGYIINTCANDWIDVTTKEKCEAYMAVVSVINYVNFEFPSVNRYRNPHCAICNFEHVSNVVCREPGGGSTLAGPAAGIPGVLFVGLFSLENKTIRCPRNTVLDEFAKKCRVFRCGRNMAMVNGKCEVKRY